MQRRVFIVANPISGGGRARRAAPALTEALRAKGMVVELVFTEGSGDAHRLAAQLDRSRCDVVVSVGGDGTLNEVANGLTDREIAIAMLPMGTANVLASEFRLPRRVDAVAELIAAGNTRRHATGTANGRRFILFVGAGLDGAMVERVEQVRTGTLGKLKWIAPVLAVARHLPRHELEIELQDGTTRTGLTEVIVTRVRNYGGVFNLPRGIDAAEDRLHVLCFRQRSRIAWLRTAAAAAFLRGLRAPTHCELLTTAALRIRAADPTPYQIDGDLGGMTPIDIRLEAEPTRLVAPPL